MATDWANLVPMVRGLLGDYDVEAPRTPTDAVYQHFNLIGIAYPKLLLTSNLPDHQYEEDLTNVQIAEVVLRAAVQILLPLPDDFTYKTPVSYVSRRDLKSSLLAYLRMTLDRVTGNFFPMESQGVLELIVKDAEQYVADLNAATSAEVAE